MTAWHGAPTTLTERLALVLLHFAWQGAIVALLALALGSLLRLRKPEPRYAFNLLALIVLAICPVATFLSLNPGSMPALTPGGQSEFPLRPHVRSIHFDLHAQDNVFTDVPSVLATTALEATGPAWFEASQHWIVWTWILGVVLLGFRLLCGCVCLETWKRHVEPVPNHVLLQAKRLCHLLDLKLPHINTSQRIREAVVTGLIRPVILFPLVWISEMPPDMLEAVLAHELAHLRRWDLWVNVFQRMIETVLFFHPAVWWLSCQLRIERELCCDKLAARLIGDRLRYAQTLEYVGRLLVRARGSELAVALGGSHMNLLKRVQFLLNPEAKTKSSGSWLAGVAAITLCLLVWRSVFYTPPACAGCTGHPGRTSVWRRQGPARPPGSPN